MKEELECWLQKKSLNGKEIPNKENRRNHFTNKICTMLSWWNIQRGEDIIFSAVVKSKNPGQNGCQKFQK